MSDENRTTAPADELLEALRGVAADASARETLAELGARARAIVEGLSRVSRTASEGGAASQRRPEPGDEGEAASRAGGPGDEGADWRRLHRGVEQLKTSVAQVSDLLEATMERLETVGGQLGEPGESVEARVAEGLGRCERVLAGIDLAISRAGNDASGGSEDGVPYPAGSASGAIAVLVVCPDSRRRADLCVAVEAQGLVAVAAVDLVSALAAAGRSRVDVALVTAPGDAEAVRELIEDWSEAEADGRLPRAALLAGRGQTAGAESGAFETLREDHGVLALAASLVAMAGDSAQRKQDRTDADPAGDGDNGAAT